MGRSPGWITSLVPQHDGFGLIQVAGIVALAPVIATIDKGSGAGAASAVALGLLVVVEHIVILSATARSWSRPAQLACLVGAAIAGYVAHQASGQPWALLALLPALQAAVILRPMLRAMAAVLVLGVAATQMGRLGSTENTLVIVIVPAVIAGLRQRLTDTIADLRETRSQLAAAAVQQERDRFSDDLHDLLGHSLSVIVVAAQVVQRAVTTTPDVAVDAGEQIETVGRRALGEVRAAVDSYRTHTLAEELRGADHALRSSGIDLSTPETIPGLPPAADAELALIVREMTTNVIRHSNAHHCCITIERDRETVRCRVEDDGDADATAAARARSGLVSVRNRLDRVGGALSITAVQPHGLRVDVTLQVPRS
ncbi:sensor histidine kinase [Luteipulveratus mongoliensis]|uniref:sensor histidine kinase n=1 Tax=Luteipulveratus mongoliensis TaxID=571913 RepID=UPI00069780DB|nr:histidine kinase [Luteipulveratus mongoliensis]